MYFVCVFACVYACVRACVRRVGSEVKLAQFLPFVTTLYEHISEYVQQLK